MGLRAETDSPHCGVVGIVAHSSTSYILVCGKRNGLPLITFWVVVWVDYRRFRNGLCTL